MVAPSGYPVDCRWQDVLKQMGVDPVGVLRRASLPDDLLNQPEPRVSTDEFFAFFRALDASAPSGDVWVHLTEALSLEWFSPPVFASMCSPNLRTATRRLALFKPLIAPVSLDVQDVDEGLRVTYSWRPSPVGPPPNLHGFEVSFLTQLARLGTKTRVQPVYVTVPELPNNTDALERYFGVVPQHGNVLSVLFSAADADRPFLTDNPPMWDFFEPELRRRLADLQGDADVVERTRAVLMEAIPSGQVQMDSVARRLGMSGRTLQRRLRGEGTTFKGMVQHTRERLARHYLRDPQLTSTEIAYLLGFEEPTSFFRAFQRWTGQTPETVRRQNQRNPDATL